VARVSRQCPETTGRSSGQPSETSGDSSETT